MKLLNDDDVLMAELLRTTKTIALIGYSPDPTRDSHRIGKFLEQAGYTVYPVNPTVKEIDGKKVYASLLDAPQPVDLVDVFRRSEFVPEIVEDAVTIGAKAVWMQLQVEHAAAAQRASDAGLAVVMNRCIKIEYIRLKIE